MHEDLEKDPHDELPVVVTDKLIELTIREETEDWWKFAELYEHLVELFNLSPTMAIGQVRGVPTISVDDMVTAIKHRCPEYQEIITAENVKLLATIFSWKTGATITQQFIDISVDLPLMVQILEEEGCFN